MSYIICWYFDSLAHFNLLCHNKMYLLFLFNILCFKLKCNFQRVTNKASKMENVGGKTRQLKKS